MNEELIKKIETAILDENTRRVSLGIPQLSEITELELLDETRERLKGAITARCRRMAESYFESNVMSAAAALLSCLSKPKV